MTVDLERDPVFDGGGDDRFEVQFERRANPDSSPGRMGQDPHRRVTERG